MKTNGTLKLLDLSLEDMLRFLENQEHPYFKNRLAILNHSIQLLLRAKTDPSKCLLHLYNSFRVFREFCDQHLNKEQNMLFPFVEETCRVINSGKAKGLPQESLLHCSLRVFRAEHRALMAHMRKISVISANFDPLVHPSPALMRLLHSFEDLEKDLQEMIYFEENLLFPSLLQMGLQLKIRSEKFKLPEMVA